MRSSGETCTRPALRTRCARAAGTRAPISAEPATRRPAPQRNAGRAHRIAVAPEVQLAHDAPAVTIRRPTAWLEMLCTGQPVPWVPVAIAPAIAWRSMSPMVVIARPAARSGSPSSKMREPARTVASPAAASTATTPARFSSDTRVPPGGVAERNEGVTAAGDAHGFAATRALGHRRGELVFAPRPHDPARARRDRARPAGPALGSGKRSSLDQAGTYLWRTYCDFLAPRSATAPRRDRCGRDGRRRRGSRWDRSGERSASPDRRARSAATATRARGCRARRRPTCTPRRSHRRDPARPSRRTGL